MFHNIERRAKTIGKVTEDAKHPTMSNLFFTGTMGKRRFKKCLFKENGQKCLLVQKRDLWVKHLDSKAEDTKTKRTEAATRESTEFVESSLDRNTITCKNACKKRQSTWFTIRTTIGKNPRKIAWWRKSQIWQAWKFDMEQWFFLIGALFEYRLLPSSNPRSQSSCPKFAPFLFVPLFLFCFFVSFLRICLKKCPFTVYSNAKHKCLDDNNRWVTLLMVTKGFRFMVTKDYRIVVTADLY